MGKSNHIDACTLMPCDMCKVKNALVKSVCYCSVAAYRQSTQTDSCRCSFQVACAKFLCQLTACTKHATAASVPFLTSAPNTPPLNYVRCFNPPPVLLSSFFPWWPRGANSINTVEVSAGEERVAVKLEEREKSKGI